MVTKRRNSIYVTDWSRKRRWHELPEIKALIALFQLPQIEQDGTDGRRFRVENGDSPGEKEEVGN